MTSSGHKIKVVCRVRPFLKTEKTDDAVVAESNNVLRVTNPRDSSKDVKFQFDACYGPAIGQEPIYKNDVRPLVETIFNGMSATVFCYGVTGAGKTHTIQGSDTEPGIIPRALEHIFMHQERDAFDYDIRISYFEIYKEAVFDLLKSRDSSTTGLPIREDANRRIFVAGLSKKQVTSFEQFDSLYQKACRNRRTASTKLNNHSSRSHAILTVQVQWKDDISEGKVWNGRLHLIDLAGSEDNRRTENGRDRMAESSAINRSLFVLGQVVEALNIGAARIPYRDSKMTRILQDSLGGDSLGMMIVNVSPGEAFLQDTHNTLSFATKSREVVNKPVAHEVVEQRWTVVDRLQHHRGAGAHSRSTIVTAAANGSMGFKRRRSDEPAIFESETSPTSAYNGNHATGALRKLKTTVGPQGRHSDTGVTGSKPSTITGNVPMRRSASSAPLPRQADLVQKVVRARVQDLEERTESTSNEIMERVMRIEKQLSNNRLDSDVVFDLFSPATKLKTSRGWLKYARELEQKGDIEKALAHYQEALKYAPELNKLETHISKLQAKLRKQKRRDSIKSHGAANVRVSDQKPEQMLTTIKGENDESDGEEDVGPLWMVDGLAESPNAEKAKRRGLVKSSVVETKAAIPAQKSLEFTDSAIGGSRPQAKRRRVLGNCNGGKFVDTKKRIDATEGSVHDHRISFGGNQTNPFILSGNDFTSDLDRRLDERKKGLLLTKKLMAKSTVAARLRQTLVEPPTPDDRNDKDFVMPSDHISSAESDIEVDLSKRRVKKPIKRSGRIPGSLGVRDIVERRLQTEGEKSKENDMESGIIEKPIKSKRTSTTTTSPEEKLQFDKYNDISIASALQMINSAELKKIMKLQGIGKRRAEQIQESVKLHGPLKHVSELQSRLCFKNKVIMGILSTFA
ncbi:kinesin-domain-containing protein [Coemansia reversa NRRL 1564]|uniref:Kinesin-like protein n=1 Tax=Coemansia reversa (strain ATCC 12441 / NRRL 1564) TaxID=763665 RepID=A0A2G5BGU6_COERN|nr:kinesin-domain-containing protein [Coemansia reversa NRRL 1564]|eukprot:PIA18248.1 kinesin-domain-containing protein [Coemansia reversa NRRL 1564]